MSVIDPTKLNKTTPVTDAPALRPQYFYDKTLLEVLRQTEFVHARWAKKKTIPKNSGTDSINFRKINKLDMNDPAAFELTEGVTPDGLMTGKSSLTARVRQYGAYMAFTDKVGFEEIDPVLTENAVYLGEHARELMDVLVRDVLAATPTVMFASTVGSDGTRDTSVVSRDGLTSDHKFNLYDIRRIIRNLRKANVKPAVNGDYICIVDPDTEFDILYDPEFGEVLDMGNQNREVVANEIARMAGCRFVRTNNAKVYEGAGAGTPPIDVHASIILGRDAYGVVDITGEGNARTITKGLGSAGTEDPLNQRQTMGYKINAFGAVILEDAAVVKYEHAVTGA